jgi:hypothetical protein
MPLQFAEEYHVPTGRSATAFTVVRSLLLLRVRAAEDGPSRHFAAAQQTVALGGIADIRHGLLDRAAEVAVVPMLHH